MIASFSFASTAHVTQWSNYLTRRAEILTRRSNLAPRKAKNTVTDLSVLSSGSEVAFDVKQVGSQLPRLFSRDQQAAVGSFLQMEVILANSSMLLNTLKKKWSREVELHRYLGTLIRESAKLFAQ